MAEVALIKINKILNVLLLTKSFISEKELM